MLAHQGTVWREEASCCELFMSGLLHVLMSLLRHHTHMYMKMIHPNHESKTVPHELLRRNKNGQEEHGFTRYRPIKAVSKPAEKGISGSSSPPFGPYSLPGPFLHSSYPWSIL